MPIRLPTICDYRQMRSPLEKGLLAGDYLTWAFMPLRRIVPLQGTPSCAFGAALLQGPTRGGLSQMDFYIVATSCASSRHSILRLWRGPSPRAYSQGIISHTLLYRCNELCLSEALYPAPLARPFSKGLRAGIISHRLSCRCDELCLFEALYPAPLVRPFSKDLLAGGIF